MIGLFIIWRQAFENDKHKLTLLNGVIYIVLQAASIGLGIVFYWLTASLSSLNVKLALVTFILMPVIAVSFTAFYGIWQDNDYNFYEEHRLTSSFDFFVHKQELGFWARLKLISLKPTTAQDKLILALTCTNFGTIILYIAITMALYTRFFGFTIGAWILMVELVIILAKKYQQNNYSYKNLGIILCLLAMLSVFVTWILVIIIRALGSSNKSEKSASGAEIGLLKVTVVASVIFFLGAIIGVLYEELKSKGTAVKKLSITFFV